MIIIIPISIVIAFLAWVLRPGINPTTSRKIAILSTTIPTLVLAIAAIIFQLLYHTAGTVEVSDISNTLFVVGLSLILAYLLASIGFILVKKGDIARGTGFGICVSIMLLVIELGLLEWLGGV